MGRASSSKPEEPAETFSATNADVGEIEEWQNEEKSDTEGTIVKKNENNIDDNNWILSLLPPGYRFCPRDEELVKSYLMKKVLNEPLPLNRIYDVNLYNHSPCDLARDCKPWTGKEWYFFTPRDRKYPNGKRPNRAARGGYWKATGADRKVTEGNNVIGERKSLVFYHGKAMKGTKSDWIMHEFRIDGLPENTSTRTDSNMRLDDWVLCRIYEKKPKKNPDNKVTDQKKKSVDDHPSASQPALQLAIRDARTETPSVSSGWVILPPSPPKSMESVNLPGSNHPDIFPQHNYSQFCSEDNRELMSRGDLIFTPIDSFCNRDFIDQFSSQPETVTSFVDDSLFPFESYDGQSQYGFIDTNQWCVNNFAAGILPPAGSDNDYIMASRWNNFSLVPFNSQLLPSDALILNPTPVSERPLGYIDQNNDMQGGSVRGTRFMDPTTGTPQDQPLGYIDQNNDMQGGSMRGTRFMDPSTGTPQDRTLGYIDQNNDMRGTRFMDRTTETPQDRTHGYIDENNDMQGGSVRGTRFMDRTTETPQDQTLGYIDQNNDMQGESVRGTRFMDRTTETPQDRTSGMQQDRTKGKQQDRTRGTPQDRTRGKQQDRTRGTPRDRTSGKQQDRTKGKKQDPTRGKQ